MPRATPPTKNLKTHLVKISPRNQPITRHEIPRLYTRHLPRQLGIPLPHIIRKHLRLRIKMVQLPKPSPTTHRRMTQRRHHKPILIQRVHRRGSRISNILPLLQLHLVRVPSARDTPLRSLFATVCAEERLPVVGNTEDEVRAAEGGDESGGVVEIGGEDLDALRGEGLGDGRGWVAG